MNEAINYFKNRWSKKKPLLIEKIELLYIRKKILWDSKYYYRLILNYMHIFNRSVEGEYSLIHHRFRDCFGAIFLINEMNFFNWKILPFQFKDIINEDVLDFIIDLTEKDKVIKIWSNYRNKILEDGSCELKNLYYILYKKCKDEITFENMDLRNVSLCLEQINKRNLCFDGAVLSYDTIVSEEMDSSILCMCVLKKRGICIGGLSDYTVRIWGINYGTFMYVLKGHKGKVTSIAYSPNEKVCLSGSEDCSLILWDIDKGESRFVLTGHESAIVKIEFINNMIVESFSSDGIIRTWNIEKGICLSITQYNELKVGKRKEPNIALLENGNILLNNGMNLIGHKKKVIDYEILPGKNILLSLSLDKSIKVWDTLNGKCQCTLTGFSEWENVIDISFEKKICISGAYDETIRVIIFVLALNILRLFYDQYYIKREKEKNTKKLKKLSKIISKLSEDDSDEKQKKIQRQERYDCIKERNKELSKRSRKIRGSIITCILIFAFFYIPRSEPIITMAKEIARVVTAPFVESPEEKPEEEKPEEEKPEEEKPEEEKPEEEKPGRKKTWVELDLQEPEGYSEINDDEMEKLYDSLFYTSEVDLDKLNEKILSAVNIWINSSTPNASLDNAMTASGRSPKYYSDIESNFYKENGRSYSSKLLDELIDGRKELFDSYPNATWVWLLANHYQIYALNYDYQTSDAKSILYFYMKSVECTQKSLEFKMDIKDKNIRINYIKWRFKDMSNCEALDMNIRRRAGYIFDAIENSLKTLNLENLSLDETEE